MYEIDLSTLMLIGITDNKTKVITSEFDFVIDENSNKIIDNSCEYFGSSLLERRKMTNRLINISSKSPIIIEESRNIIFFPLKSIRSFNNTWISFNNLDNYKKEGNKTILNFKCGKSIILDFSYYVIDNQVTRSMMLDYDLISRRKSL